MSRFARNAETPWEVARGQTVRQWKSSRDGSCPAGGLPGLAESSLTLTQPARPKCCRSWRGSGQVLLVGPHDEPQSRDAHFPGFCPPPGSGLKGLGGPQPLPPGGQADSLLPPGPSQVGGQPGRGQASIRAGKGQQPGQGGEADSTNWGGSWRGPGEPLEAFPIPWFTGSPLTT